jgi:hypothetical protein
MNMLCAGVVRGQQDACADLSDGICPGEKATEPVHPVVRPLTPLGVYEVRDSLPGGRGVGREAVKHLRTIWILGILAVGLCSAVFGLLVCLHLRGEQTLPRTSLLAPPMLALSVWLLLRRSTRKLEALAEQRTGV